MKRVWGDKLVDAKIRGDGGDNIAPRDVMGRILLMVSTNPKDMDTLRHLNSFDRLNITYQRQMDPNLLWAILQASRLLRIKRTNKLPCLTSTQTTRYPSLSLH
jgi:hypothetical protein